MFPEIIRPDWNLPSRVKAMSTTRLGGVSEGLFASLNLAGHVDDDPRRVEENRQILGSYLNLPAEPAWLEQTHSIRVIDLDYQQLRDGDAAVTRKPGQIAVVMTADCLPVLFSNAAGDEVAAAHAGWRGLLKGVLEQTVFAMQSAAHDVHAWLGPAIGPLSFEVGEEVYRAFIEEDASIESSFTANRPGHYLCDIYSIARRRLNKAGISHIYGGGFCTYQDRERFFSYRRDHQTGRQASLIYFD